MDSDEISLLISMQNCGLFLNRMKQHNLNVTTHITQRYNLAQLTSHVACVGMNSNDPFDCNNPYVYNTLNNYPAYNYNNPLKCNTPLLHLCFIPKD